MTTHEMIALARPEETLRRVQLVPRAVMTLPRSNHNIRVIAGIAWIVMDGQDYILRSGQNMKISTGQFDSVMSSLGESMLIAEIETLR
jgi:hypothetical protein